MKMLAHSRLLLLCAGLLAVSLTGCQKSQETPESKGQTERPKDTEVAKVGTVAEVAKVEIPAPQAIDDLNILGRLQLRDPNQLVDRLASWVTLVQPTMTSETLRQQAAAAGMPLQDLKPGQSVSAFVLAPAEPNGPPAMAALVPASASSQFVQTLSRQIPDSGVTSAGQYTMVVRGLALTTATQIGSKLAPLAQTPPATDFQIYLNTVALMAKYGPQLNAGAQAIPSFVAMAAANQPGGGARMTQLLPILQAETTALIDFLGQAQYLSLGADLDRQMFELSMIAKGQPGTTLDKILQSKPVSAPDLGGYLDKNSAVRAQQTIRDLKGFIDIYMKYIEVAIGPGKQVEMAKFREELKDLEKIGKATSAMGLNMTPEGKAVYQIVVTTDDNAAYMELVRKKALNWLNAGLIHDFYKNMGIEMNIKEDPQTRKVAGAEVHRFMMNLTAGPSLPPAEKANLEKMFGGAQFEMAQIGDFVVFTLGEPIDALAGRVASGQKGESIQAMKTYPEGGCLYLDLNVPAMAKLLKSSMPAEQASRVPDFAPGAPPIMAAAYHTGGLAWYRMGIPRELIAALTASQSASQSATQGATQSATQSTTQSATQGAPDAK